MERASAPLLIMQQQQEKKNKQCCFFFSCRRCFAVFAFVLCVLTALHEGARRIETMAIAATGEDESVVEYNRILAKAHGTDAPRIFSGGGVVDKAKEAKERLGEVVLMMMMRGGKRRTRTTREDVSEESIDGLSTSSSSSIGGSGVTTKAKKQRKERRRGKNNEDENEGDDFDEEEESAVNADDPSLLKVELPKSYEKALREDIEKMLRKMPKFTNKTLLTSSGCLKGDAYSSNSNSIGGGGGGGGGVTSANVPKLEIFPNANERSWPGVNTDADFHDGK